MIICVFFDKPVKYIADGKEIVKTDFILSSKRIDTKFQIGFLEITTENKCYVFRVEDIASMCQYLTD